MLGETALGGNRIRGYALERPATTPQTDQSAAAMATNPPRMRSLTDRPDSRETALPRRLVTIPTVAMALALLIPALIVMIPIAAVFDVVGRRRLGTVRLLMFGACYLLWEAIAVAAAFLLWIATGFGLFTDRPWSRRAHRRLQACWVDSLLGLARPLLGLRIEIEGADALRDGPLVMLCRHASMVDTLLPAHLLFHRGFGGRYVLKRELLWDPALDIIGHRIPNHFLDRSSADTEAELRALEQLARDATDGEAVVIFPEGTRWTADKCRRARAFLESSDPSLAARTPALTHTMPPRPRGTIAVFAGSPAADVVTMAHTGLEVLTGPVEALRLLPFRHPVRISLWRTPRSEIPVDHDGRVEWLTDEWARVDAWIDARSDAPRRVGGPF